ncbi:carboxylesterase family protein [Streptomyces sp. ISL-66]|uniref:carboxylesterase/lipase family protein n=1 Tax=Streptomyces sp. ISL-66 TaxID=2819186 RepID=UPI001BEC426F|nr:carboxylesterase family protein [Streptomyces sp. ISL-66]MBT2469336.1 carboxylesterase family protein [Streptomyces sp. ISL-66]
MGVAIETLNGTIEGTAQNGLSVFKGIPYALPPEGPLRFQAPAPVPAWDGVRPATSFSAAPPQLPLAPGMPAVWRPEDGLDCLSVNVWTPGGAGDRLPVMVWIYGGGWKTGYSGDPGYDGEVLARGGVVLVTFNYRVGFEGFGFVPGAPANRGFLDQTAALTWVNENIAAFGGDPDNVTVFGESGGGASVASLLSAPAARGLFRRAIVQSIAGRYLPEEEAQRISVLIGEAVGVGPGDFASVPPEALLAVQDVALPAMREDPSHWTTPEAITAFSPVIDGVTVVDKPWLAIRSGCARDVDLICGYTHDEFTLFAMQRGLVKIKPSALIKAVPMMLSMARAGLRERASRRPAQASAKTRDLNLDTVAEGLGLGRQAAIEYRSAYPGLTDPQLYVTMFSDALFRMPATWLAEAHAAAGGRAWLYDFMWSSPAFGGALGACHTMDIPATFGHTQGPLSAFLFGGKAPPQDFTRLSEHLRASWFSFAASGDPGWAPFTTEKAMTRIWEVEPSVAEDPLRASRRIWHKESGL